MHLIPFLFLSKAIPWGALSGLSAPHSGTKKVLYSVDDSVFIKSKIFTIDTTKNPPKITKSMYIKDTDNVLANFNTTDTAASPIGFTATELALLINSDKTVNLDQEGIVAVVDGFWIAHEGAGSKPDVGSLNLLIKVNTTGIIKDVVSLPNGVNGIQTSNGFEGVTKEGDYLIVAFQREWGGEARVRLGLYNLINRTWKFVYYPLDRPQSQFGGELFPFRVLVSVKKYTHLAAFLTALVFSQHLKMVGLAFQMSLISVVAIFFSLNETTGLDPMLRSNASTRYR